jgi:hypothetical protein
LSPKTAAMFQIGARFISIARDGTWLVAAQAKFDEFVLLPIGRTISTKIAELTGIAYQDGEGEGQALERCAGGVG